jgi:hypothetical protein
MKATRSTCIKGETFIIRTIACLYYLPARLDVFLRLFDSPISCVSSKTIF